MTSTVPNPSRRKYLEAEVAERARHGTAEEVRTTCSFARAERLLGREYHGRFLIELFQNAADAWRSDPRSLTGRSPVAVVVGDGPALLVANQGAVMTPEVVIESLGHIGASTKSEGEAIGHKGIGFKSVLEITLAPEIYSGLQEAQPGLAVSFDPQAARTSILRESPRWDELLTSVQGLDPSDELAAVPILRFPHWVDELPKDVARLAEDGFDTVVRLPFDTRSAERLGLDEDAWLATVRHALDDVSDQILLLLGCFADVRIEDRLAATKVLIQPEWDKRVSAPSPDLNREEVTILRDGEISSTWRLFRRTLPALEHLAGEVAVGLRCMPGERMAPVVPAVDGGPSAPFHLFFPTRIASGLPFLLHGYFEVDASRTGFYRGSTERNRAILDELATLVAEAVRDAAEDPAIDLVTRVDLIAACDEPEDVLAREFRELVLGRLDRHGWIPVADDGTGHVRARPDEVLVAKPELTRHLARVFSSSYLSHRVQLRAPEDALTDRALELVAARQPRDQGSLWEILANLCRPGATPIWQGDDADRGFRALLDLLDALEVEDRAEAKSLIEGLRGDPDSCLLPASETSGGRQLLPVPDPSEGVAGRRSRLVMARARATKGEALVPPDELDLAFLPEGLLASEADIDRATASMASASLASTPRTCCDFSGVYSAVSEHRASERSAPPSGPLCSTRASGSGVDLAGLAKTRPRDCASSESGTWRKSRSHAGMAGGGGQAPSGSVRTGPIGSSLGRVARPPARQAISAPRPTGPSRPSAPALGICWLRPQSFSACSKTSRSTCPWSRMSPRTRKRRSTTHGATPNVTPFS